MRKCNEIGQRAAIAGPLHTTLHALPLIRRVGEAERRQIEAGAFVPINIHPDGAYGIEVRVGQSVIHPPSKAVRPPVRHIPAEPRRERPSVREDDLGRQLVLREKPDKSKHPEELVRTLRDLTDLLGLRECDPAAVFADEDARRRLDRLPWFAFAGGLVFEVRDAAWS